MKVYELGCDDRFLWVYSPHKQDRLFALDNFRGDSMEKKWYPLEVLHLIQSKADRKKLVGDFPNWGAGAPVFSKKAVDSLRDTLELCGEILPLKCVDGDYYAFNVTNVISVLDESHSELKRFSNGNVMSVRKYVFHEDLLQDELIFKIPQKTNLVYVTEAFIERVSEAKLQGFKFPEVYPHTEDPWAFMKKKS